MLNCAYNNYKSNNFGPSIYVIETSGAIEVYRKADIVGWQRTSIKPNMFAGDMKRVKGLVGEDATITVVWQTIGKRTFSTSIVHCDRLEELAHLEIPATFSKAKATKVIKERRK